MNIERDKLADDIVEKMSTEEADDSEDAVVFAKAWSMISEMVMDGVDDDDKIVVTFGENGELAVKVTSKEKYDE